LLAKGIEAEFEEVQRTIAERDHRDMTREDSPLIVAPDAHVIDTSHMTIDEVVDAVAEIARKTMG
jgi:cytidylate kinase